MITGITHAAFKGISSLFDARARKVRELLDSMDKAMTYEEWLIPATALEKLRLEQRIAAGRVSLFVICQITCCFSVFASFSDLLVSLQAQLDQVWLTGQCQRIYIASF